MVVTMSKTGMTDGLPTLRCGVSGKHIGRNRAVTCTACRAACSAGDLTTDSTVACAAKTSLADRQAGDELTAGIDKHELN